MACGHINSADFSTWLFYFDNWYHLFFFLFQLTRSDVLPAASGVDVTHNPITVTMTTRRFPCGTKDT